MEIHNGIIIVGGRSLMPLVINGKTPTDLGIIFNHPQIVVDMSNTELIVISIKDNIIKDGEVLR
jgi:hypothetical protein